MKFNTYIHKIVQNYPLIFCIDPCTHIHTRGVNVRARVLSRQNVRAHIFALCGRMCKRIFTKYQWIILYYLINISFKFYKDPSFRCGYICKTVLTFNNFQCIFHIFTITPLRSLQRWIITEWLWNVMECLGNQISKCPDLME